LNNQQPTTSCLFSVYLVNPERDYFSRSNEKEPQLPIIIEVSTSYRKLGFVIRGRSYARFGQLRWLITATINYYNSLQKFMAT